jgi:hypothetical protein
MRGVSIAEGDILGERLLAFSDDMILTKDSRTFHASVQYIDVRVNYRLTNIL